MVLPPRRAGMLFIIQNDPIVPPGLLESVLLDDGTPFEVVRAFAGDSMPEVGLSDALVVLGGTMSIDDTEEYPFLREVKGLIKRVLNADIPFLGICLGGQLMAEALGGRVLRNTDGEFGRRTVILTEEGWADPLFCGAPEQFPAFEWHNDSFVPSSEGVISLARSDSCKHQAIRYGRAAYGIQFHPEVDRNIIGAWSGGGKPIQNEFEIDFERNDEAYQLMSKTLFESFLKISKLRR